MSTRRQGPGSGRPDPNAAPDPASPATRGPAANATARAALRVGVGAFVVGALGLLVAVAALVGWGGRSCRTTAWNAVTAAADLPAGWSVGTSQVVIDGLATTLVGPTSADDTMGAPAIYVMVSCYDGDASTALDRSRAAAEAGGETVVARSDLGDAGYAIEDAFATTTVVYFRRGGLVASVAPSGAVDPLDLEAALLAVLAAVDRASSGVVAPAPPASGPSSSAPVTTAEPSPSEAALESAGPDPSAAAPDLLALLPTEVAGTTLVSDSAIGTDILGADTSSRAMIAALGTLGRTPADLQVAQAYDENGELDVYLLAFRVPGTPAADLAAIVVGTWLSGSTPGVTTATVTLGGRELTKVTYGDQGAASYVRATGEAVFVIETSDETLASAVAALLP
ncbi:MAG: hypothetical protein ABIG85_02875 [Chloroflexota bacterium]